METWKDIPGYEGLYQASDLGRILSVKRNKILKPTKFNNKYEFVTLYKCDIVKKCKVARLIALTFIPNPLNKPQVNHKNENVCDNRVCNLEWCTAKYNINYGTANARRAKTLSKRVAKLSLDGDVISIYDSLAEAADKNKGCYDSNISRCCNKHYGFKTCGGFKWCYVDMEEENELQRKTKNV